ncbi:MAG TPA: methionyl-tRNA formyltransferase [Solirubrobacteraceae bacterium]|nr:methionyl-tRNA formyltransferase [Solirubrobacteraceae bacterium]
MRTVFAGTSSFAGSVLERLATTEHRPVLVVTRPDRPKGRGRRPAPPPVALVARELGIEVAQPGDVNDEAARRRIAAAAPEVVCVCAFGALIREPLLSDHLMLNVHPSLLPRWRGAAPVERAIMAGDARTGVSIMRVTAGLDSGPVCLQQPDPVSADDTYGSLAPRLEDRGARLLVRALRERPPFAEQDEAGATYAAKIGPADRLLDPSRPARELERTVRALHPHIGARAVLPDGETLTVHAAAARDEGPSPGRLATDRGRLLLGCATGTLELLVVQPAGGRPMDAAAYLRGHAPV